MARFVPILYKANETNFDSFGIGRLTACTEGTVTESLNCDNYELTLKYPTSEKIASEINADCVIVAKPNRDENAEPQRFRVYSVETTLGDGIVTVNATHDTLVRMHNCISVPGEVSGTIADIWNSIRDGKIIGNTEWPFQFYSDVTTEAKISFTVPTTLYDIIYNENDGVLKKFGAELKLNGNTICILKARGGDYGTAIRETVNMSSLTKTVDASECVTGVCPYYAYTDDDGDTIVVYADPPVVSVESTDLNYDHIVPVDCSNDIEKPAWAADNWVPEKDMLTEYGEQYLEQNYESRVPVTYAAGVVTDMNEVHGRIALGDTVYLLSRTTKTRIQAKVVSTVYSFLKDDYDTIEIGSVRSNLAQTLVDMTNTKKSVKQINMSIRAGESGIFKWQFNKALSLVDIAFSSPNIFKCKYAASGGGYKSYPSVKVSIPQDDMEYMKSWEWDGDAETQFVGSSEGTVKIVVDSHSSTSVYIHAQSTVKETVNGQAYVHWKARNPDIDDNHYITTLTWRNDKNVYTYADCKLKSRIAYVSKNKDYHCVGKCNGAYAVLSEYGNYYRVGWTSVSGGAEAVQDISNGATWTADKETKLYAMSCMRTKVGKIPAGTVCKCLDIIDGVFLITWEYETGNHRIGFTKNSGGILIDEEA